MRAAHLEPVEARQHEVEDHQVGGEPLAQLHALDPVGGDGDVEALAAQAGGHRRGDRRFVLDDEDRAAPTGDCRVGRHRCQDKEGRSQESRRVCGDSVQMMGVLPPSHPSGGMAGDTGPDGGGPRCDGRAGCGRRPRRSRLRWRLPGWSASSEPGPRRGRRSSSSRRRRRAVHGQRARDRLQGHGRGVRRPGRHRRERSRGGRPGRPCGHGSAGVPGLGLDGRRRRSADGAGVGPRVQRWRRRARQRRRGRCVRRPPGRHVAGVPNRGRRRRRWWLPGHERRGGRGRQWRRRRRPHEPAERDSKGFAGQSGGFAQGGVGGPGGAFSIGGGGGGGGGWFGGGGGGGGWGNSFGSGRISGGGGSGGGGSNHGPAGADFAAGVRLGNGKVTITYDPGAGSLCPISRKPGVPTIQRALPTASATATVSFTPPFDTGPVR